MPLRAHGEFRGVLEVIHRTIATRDAAWAAARIFAVVDVYDALSSDRPYRSAWPRDRVLGHLRAESGRHFDPAVVGAFLELIEA